MDGERRVSNEALQEAEARLRSVIEVVPDLIFLIDEEGRLAEIVASKSELLYAERSSLPGRLVSDIFPEEETQMFMGVIRETIRTGETQVIEYSLDVPAGRRWFEGRTSLYPLELRGKRAIVFLARDIGDRRRTETAVRTLVESSSRYYGHAFFASMAQDLAATLGADYTLIGELQKGAVDSVQTLAVSADGELVPNFRYDLAGTPCANVMGKSACSYKADVADLFPRDTLLREMMVQGYVGTPLFASDGSPLGVMAALYRSPLQETGFAESILQVFSARVGGELERMRVEQALQLRDHQYHSMLHSSMDGFWIVSAMSGRLIDVNEASCQMSGYERHELLGMSVSDLEATETPEREARHRRKLTETGYDHFETRHRRKDGLVIDVEISATYVAGEEGLVYVFLRDISERKQTERELLKHRERLEELVEERTADLERAGNALKEYSARIVRAQEDERARISRELHDDGLQSLSQVSRDLEALVLSSMAGDNGAAAELSRIRTQLGESIRSLRELASGLRPPLWDELGLPAALEALVSRVSEGAGIEISFHADPEASSTGGDESLAVYRIAQEALSNVVRHSGAGRASVYLGWRPDAIHLRVCDGGFGFGGASQSPSENRGRLGLVGMRERARSLGGSVRVRSIRGLGTAIRVTIPRPSPSLEAGPATNER